MGVFQTIIGYCRRRRLFLPSLDMFSLPLRTHSVNFSGFILNALAWIFLTLVFKLKTEASNAFGNVRGLMEEEEKEEDDDEEGMT